MTDAELLTLIEIGGQVEVPYFDGLPVTLMNDGISNEAEGCVARIEALSALKSYLTLTPLHRQADGRHLVAYCRMMIEAVGEEVLGDIGGVEPTLETVWTHVTPTLIFFGFINPGKYVEQRTIYLQLEGNVAWEPEHGLQMSWENGDTLVKAGAFDGHPTNGHASANPEKDKYVFDSYKPELRTVREGS